MLLRRRQTQSGRIATIPTAMLFEFFGTAQIGGRTQRIERWGRQKNGLLCALLWQYSVVNASSQRIS